MAGKKKGKLVSALNRQNRLMLSIILISFLGSALLIWSFNTNALRASVETETHLAAALLANEINTNIPKEKIRTGAASGNLLTELRIMEENSSSVWIVDGQGQVYYRSGDEANSLFTDPELLKTMLSSAQKEGASVIWLGNMGFLFLQKQCCVVRPIYDGDLFLVTVNHANDAHALQRRQFTLMLALDVLLLVVMMILVVNTFVKYRRQLIRLATTDELTDLANRKNFNAEFAEFSATEPLPPFSLFLLDVDYFKQINDNYGHTAGDHALHYLAQQIKAMIKEQGGFAGRWGGDEFIGVLTQSGEKAYEAVNALCRRIEGAELEDGFRMTISAGVVDADGERRLMKLAERADLALYESKEQGRNQVSLYRADMKGNSAAVERAQPEKRADPAALREPEQNLPDKREDFKQRLIGYIRNKLISSTILGVRWMAPFVAGGGILIALAFLFDAASVDLSALPVAERSNFGSITAQAAALKSIGGTTFNYMLPVFAGFMAYGIGGEEAFMTGFVGGYMTINSNAGFIGAMLAGFAAGVITNEVGQFTGRLPGFIRKAAPIIIYPVFNLLLMQVLSLLVITPISSAIGKLFTGILTFFESRSAVSTGTLSAMMMAVDMGGIVNKVAYNYGVASIAAGHTDIMASVMIGGMVPPIGIALSILLFRNKYTELEQERGLSAMFMGLSFITEGALPFVFTDIGRVIPACMLGSAVAGMLSSLFGCTLPAPHGGMFVLPVMGHPLLYLIALAAGSLVTALTLGVWKKEKTPGDR